MTVEATTAIPAITPAAAIPAPVADPTDLPQPAWRARLEAGLPHLAPQFAGDISVALRLLERRETRIARLNAELAELRQAARAHLSAGGIELAAVLPHTSRALANAIGGSS